MKPRSPLTLFFAAVLLFLLCPASGAYGADILAVRHWTAPDYTRVVIDTQREIPYEVREGENALTVILPRASLAPGIPSQFTLKSPAVRGISVLREEGGGLSFRIDLFPGTKIRTFKLAKVLDLPYRIVVDVSRPDIEKEEQEIREKVRREEKKPVVVIDPGHGGEDPGAVGKRRTREKHAVLAVARLLRDALTDRGYDAFLTRDGDYYVPFSRRLKIAREYGADLFISVHADACRSRGARGSSVYCLSTGGASNVAARLLADSQNLSDMIAGFTDEQSNGESDPITLSMVQTETMNRARDLGTVLLDEMGKVNHVKFEKVQEAPFRVLKLPEVPSVLVETAYISNPREELLLREKTFQKQIAGSIAEAVAAYLPVPGTPVFVREESPLPEAAPVPVRAEAPAPAAPIETAAAKKEEPPPETHIVRKGDSLTDIARRYDLTVAELLRINRLRDRNRIFVGQEIRIVEKEKPAPPAAVPAVYVVRRGDTLEGIAGRFGVTVRELQKTNDLSSKNRIQAGWKLKIPGKPAGERVVTYVVRRGDTLEGIARRFGVPVDVLAEQNGLRSKNLLPAGAKLEVRGAAAKTKKEKPVTYVVRRGDTLEKIARKYDTSVEALMTANGIRYGKRILVNQRLRIP
ncbi:MAG TPA: LysM peptidoglycan-binding domain-containing protein [Syntrophales bacterium]|nr:LysM peptidoglycan-binding domain-containing protein [Syntrophales bacterium]HQQ26415.1 LysM peptidoglycan-binding domain-containing protein [Syntrophales bacterium]